MVVLFETFWCNITGYWTLWSRNATVVATTFY